MITASSRLLAGLDLLLLAVLARLTPGLALPFSLSLTAKSEEQMTDDEKKKDAKKAASSEDEEKKDAEKKDAQKCESTPDDDEEKKDEEKKSAKKSESDEDEDDEKKKEPASAQAATPLAARLSAAFASLSGTGPAKTAAALSAEQSAHAATRSTLTQAQADLASARASLASTEAALATLCAYVGVQSAELAGKSPAEIHAALDARVTAQAIEQVAGLGFNPKGLPAPSGAQTGEAKTRAELLREYHGLTDPSARAAFYAAHRDNLLG
jgi:hypothetical protein